MKFVFVGTRNGKPTINWPFALVAAVFLAVVCTCISLLLGALAPDVPLVGSIGWAISTLVPIMICMAGVLRGLNTPPDQLPKLD
jgi:hypothetical protein